MLQASAVGRSRKAALPEADELRRHEPALLDLIDEEPAEQPRRRGTMAG